MGSEGAHIQHDSGSAPAMGERTAVVDIGSNSIRLVVNEGPARTPFPVFNEKAVCALGRGLAGRGTLNPEGVALALRCLTRFARLAEAMGIARVDLLATAAVREARDGPAFVAEVERRFGRPVTVLSGEAEARLAGLGVISGRPDADGLMGDLGGGSLDLVMFDAGAFGDSATLPLGSLRLVEAAGGDPARARAIVEAALRDLPWLARAAGRTLYPIGGSWRALAHIAINQTGHSLHVLDGYEMSLGEAVDLARLIAGLSRRTLETIPGISPRRLDTLPWAALVMERLLAAARPSRLVFTVHGMREGQYFSNLPPAVRDTDPLIGACEALGHLRRRFPVGGRALWEWSRPLFAGEDPARAHLRLAACMLGDVAWMEHPDYRPEAAFRRVLRAPFTGIDHPRRVALAFAICARHGGEAGLPAVWRHRALLGEADERWGLIVGRALRLAFTLSGGLPDLLAQTRLEVADRVLTLRVPDGGEVFLGEAVERRLDSLGRVLGLPARIVFGLDLAPP